MLICLSDSVSQPAVKSEDKTETPAKSAKKIIHLYRYCQGQHWDNKCLTRRVHFAAMDVNGSDNKIDINVLEHLTDDLDSKPKN